MATAAVTYAFAPNTLIESAKANTNFQDLVTFLNNETIHKDASKVFTAVPSGPALDPTSDNQFARKAYVDKAKAIARQKLTSNSINYSTDTNTDFVLSPTMDSTRLYAAHLHVTWDLTGIGTYVLELTEDANVIAALAITDLDRWITDSVVLMEPTSGAHTYRIHLDEVSDGATIQFTASATSPRWFWIEDIGPR